MHWTDASLMSAMRKAKKLAQENSSMAGKQRLAALLLDSDDN
jgi:hypothetical protein